MLRRRRTLDEAARFSALIDAALVGVIQRGSAWNEVFADAMHQHLVIDADTVRQNWLRKLDQALATERMRLEAELKRLDSDVPDETLDAWGREVMRLAGEH